MDGPLLDPADHRALARLLQRTLGRGYKLVLVELARLDDHRRLLALVQADVAGLGGRVRAVDLGALPGHNLWEELRAPLAGLDARCEVIVAWGALDDRVDGERIVRQLNVQRDLYTRDHPVPWVVAVSPGIARRLQDEAPDFTDYASLWVKAGEVRWRDEPALRPPERRRSDRDEPDPGRMRSERVRQARAARRRGALDEARDLLGRVAVSADAADPRVRAELLLEKGRIAVDEGALDAAGQLLGEARASAVQAGARRLEIDVVAALAGVAEDRGALQDALALDEEQLRLVRAHRGSPQQRGRALRGRARLLERLGRADEAEAAFEEALALYRGRGMRWFEALVLLELAALRRRAGALDAAGALLDGAAARAEGERGWLAAQVLLGQARLHAARGEGKEAIAAAQAAIEALGEQRSAASRGEARIELAGMLLERGDRAAAAQQVELARAELLPGRMASLDALRARLGG